MTNGSQQNINHFSLSHARVECIFPSDIHLFHISFNIVLLLFFLCLNACSRKQQQGVGQTVNGEVDAAVDYSAKTHELQTIIEKQVLYT